MSSLQTWFGMKGFRTVSYKIEKFHNSKSRCIPNFMCPGRFDPVFFSVYNESSK